MAVFIRAKRVTDPLDEKTKARLRGDDCGLMAGYASSGNEHKSADPSCFSGLVHAFLENDGASSTAANAYDQGSEFDSEEPDCSVDSAKLVQDLLEESRNKDLSRVRLLSDVCEVAEALASLRSSGSGYLRAVVERLWELGFNAGLCRAKWETCGGLTGGSYDYIDVITTEYRYVVDLNFAGEFEIARPTEEYRRVVESLPRVVVGTAEEVRQLVRIVGDAARRSLRRQDLHVPPWRMTRYMLAKWFGPYRRTVNPVPSSAGVVMAAGAEVKCRAVGFHAAPRLLVSYHATRDS